MSVVIGCEESKLIQHSTMKQDVKMKKKKKTVLKTTLKCNMDFKWLYQ